MINYTEYNIKAEQSNFTPVEPFLPGLGKSFEFRVVFHHSCYFSWADWDFDKDWKDVNKLIMRTLAYTPNNHLSYGAGFMPANIENEILVTAYTNYPGTDFQTARDKSLSIPTYESLQGATPFVGRVIRKRKSVQYYFEHGKRKLEMVEHKFKMPRFLPWVGRWTGTYMGGANNAPGEYGGKASQNMKLWLWYKTI